MLKIGIKLEVWNIDPQYIEDTLSENAEKTFFLLYSKSQIHREYKDIKLTMLILKEMRA